MVQLRISLGGGLNDHTNQAVIVIHSRSIRDDSK